MRKPKKKCEGGNIIRIIGGTSTWLAEEEINITATEGDVVFSSQGKVNIIAEKIVFGDYVPPEEIYTTHPEVKKVEFINEKGNILNEHIFSDKFFFGQKLKIKITTENTIDNEHIYLKLKGYSESKNQKFDTINRYNWTELKILNNQVETDYFTLNPNWYSDDFEEYDYTKYNTKIEKTKLNEFFVKISLNADTVYLPLKGERLKPSTYKRNYEELLGLNKTPKSTSTIDKDLIDNYENEFIDKYQSQGFPEIKNIVDDFSEHLCEYVNCTSDKQTIDEIEKKVITSAKNLWNEAVDQNKEHKSYEDTIDAQGNPIKKLKVNPPIYDDRPLYWARIAMQVILKRQYVFIKEMMDNPRIDEKEFFEKSIVPKGSKLEEVIQLFEIHSRNYEGIDFSKAGNKKKKLLMLGFDPFVINPYHPNNLGIIKRQNPSGITILSLHGKIRGNAYIQCAMIPVRYEDFDNEIIEKIVKNNIKDFDIMFTTSKNGVDFDLERFACKFRGGYLDNMNIGYQRHSNNKLRLKQLPIIWDGFHETTLPVIKIMQGILLPNTKKLYYDQSFEDDMGNKQKHPKSLRNNTSKNLPINIKTKSSNTKSKGSGGWYLSNEIMYRATKTRDDLGHGKGGSKKLKEVGHIHISKLQSPKEYLLIIKHVITNATK